MSEQQQLFETEDQYGNDIIQGPKLVKQKLTKAQAIIDPKNPSITAIHLFFPTFSFRKKGDNETTTKGAINAKVRALDKDITEME